MCVIECDVDGPGKGLDAVAAYIPPRTAGVVARSAAFGRTVEPARWLKAWAEACGVRPTRAIRVFGDFNFGVDEPAAREFTARMAQLGFLLGRNQL